MEVKNHNVDLEEDKKYVKVTYNASEECSKKGYFVENVDIIDPITSIAVNGFYWPTEYYNEHFANKKEEPVFI